MAQYVTKHREEARLEPHRRVYRRAGGGGKAAAGSA
jgi:hypothetical protein